MSTIGSFYNPYSYSDYVQESSNGTWSCGWVRESDDVVYISHEEVRYSGKGEYSNPIPESLLNEMINYNYWIGGWVRGSRSRKYYCDIRGNSYEEDYGGSSNPWPLSVYTEMCEKNIWDGGWVMYSDGTAHLIRNINLTENSGCGCGCGSGCGCGCGSSSNDGTDYGSGNSEGSKLKIDHGEIIEGKAFFSLNNGDFELIICWTNGYTYGSSNMSTVKYNVTCKNTAYDNVSETFWGTWSDIYELHIGGVIVFDCTTKKNITYYCDDIITIPEDKRKKKEKGEIDWDE